MGVAAVSFILAVLTAVPSLGISLGAAKVVVAAAAVYFAAGRLMNHLGGNKELNFNFSRKWFLPSYPGINRTEPRGFNDIWELWNAVSGRVSQIVNAVGASQLRNLANRSRTNRVCVLAQIIYDAYTGKRIVRSNYRIN